MRYVNFSISNLKAQFLARRNSIMSRLIALFTVIILFASNSTAQADLRLAEESSNQWWFSMGLIFVCGTGLAIFFWWRSKKGARPAENQNRYSSYYAGDVEAGFDDVDGDKELEWLRKVKKPNAKTPKLKFGLKKPEHDRPPKAKARGEEAAGIDTAAFQEKMRKLQYAQLPINSFTQLAAAKNFKDLPISDDAALLDAIDQAGDEFEEDEAVREVALRVLAAFKNKNSVDALTQIALYDLSSSLRSKAVAALADFDHESVFDSILLACADPTREVRAAAAHGLFKLSFDRSHAWKRIIEANDEYRLTQAARAAIEAGFVEKSIERLTHDDVKVAYEAFAMCSLLIKAGETNQLLTAIKDHNDLRVKFAVLHLLSVQKDERVLPELYEIANMRSLSKEVADRVRNTISVYEDANAWVR